MDKLLSGWKTYLTVLAAIITAVAAFANGAISLPDLVTAIFAAIGTATMRHALTTTVSNAVDKKL